ncbi:MAG: response regulator [Rhodoferax sp.]|nr:response regulator [Rhodoferax sp.]
MNQDDDPVLVFVDQSAPTLESANPWKILIVDDDATVHAATEFGLDQVRILEQPLAFLHAYSAAQARQILEQETGIAVILLDVVMESDDAGLQLARYVREDLGLQDVRIILRTGQPGYAPEFEVVRQFDINDYRTKSELTQKKLNTALTTAIRSYQQLNDSTQRQQRLERENLLAESRLREGETRFRYLAAVASEAIIVTNSDNHIEIWNPGAENLFGLKAQDVLGKRIAFTIPEHYQDERKRSFAQIVQNTVQKSGKLDGIELILSPLPQADNSTPLEWSVTSWDTGSGLLYSSIFRDISERCRFEEQLIAARDAATASAKVKAEFLANMSHEIRTPMHGILGMTELLLATGLTLQQREYIELARNSAEGLLRLINDLLDFSKMEARKLSLEQAPFHLRQTLQDVLQPQIMYARQRAIALTLDVDPEIPETLVGDSLRWSQVVLNLVSNALKFTASGSIAITLKIAGRDGTRLQLQCSVRDTGVGIAAGKLSQIFEAFIQADSSTSREFGGTGLGLSICMQLVQLMQGTIWVESQIGQGSTFHFTAWLDCPQKEISDVAEQGLSTVRTVRNATQGAQGEAMQALNILLAEDNLVNQKFALAVLSSAGHTLTLAHNGQEAVDHVREQVFDLILMDIQMPVMDGFEATRRIRRMGCTTPIIAMTAHAMGGLREMCLETGMNDYISKPIRAAVLLEKLSDIRRAVPDSGTDLGTDKSVTLDLSEALLMVGGDRSLLSGLAQLVLEQLDTDIPSLRALSSAGDPVLLRDAAHRLKGSLASVAALAAYEACKTLETLAKQAQVAEFVAAMQRLDVEVARLRVELTKFIKLTK